MRSQSRKKRPRPEISMGVELETYSIALPENRICRELHFPKRSTIEPDERFTRDWSIGSEYNSKIFTTLREAFFLLKSSLRKYSNFHSDNGTQKQLAIFPVGGWIDRFAGSHIHFALGKQGLSYEEAREIAVRLHDHLPFMIALGANSPVWREKITGLASNRLFRGSNKYCKVTRREVLYKDHFREMTFNRGGKKKAPTLEIRVLDSAIPEYLVAVLCVARAVALRWVKNKEALNQCTHTNYLKARDLAIRLGPKAKLVWANHWMRVPNYVDLFFRKYEEELRQMDIPDDVLRVFKYFKKGWNQSEVIREAARRCYKKHRPTWQRQFAKKYASAIKELLDGNSFKNFAKRLGVRLPNIDRTWLGRKGAKW